MPDLPQSVTEEKYTDENGHVVIKRVMHFNLKHSLKLILHQDGGNAVLALNTISINLCAICDQFMA
jgi:hypothetical protein